MSETPPETPDEALVATLARKFRVEVDISEDGTPEWVQVRGINELTPGIDSNLEDDSDYDSDGWTSQTKTSMGWSLEMKMIRKIGFTTKLPDPGQEKIRLAADEFGVDGTAHVRWYDRTGGPEAYEGYGTVTWSPDGGGVTALDSASCTITGQGRRVKITNPVTPVTP